MKALLCLSSVQLALASFGFTLAPAASKGVAEVLMFLAALAFVGCAAALTLGGRRDLRTRPLAAFFLVNASAQTQPLVRMLGESYPNLEWIQWVRSLLPECFIPFFLWRFVRVFPRVVHLDRWSTLIDRAIRISYWLAMVMFSLNALDRLVPRLRVSAWPMAGWMLRSALGAYWYLLFGLMIPALVVAFMRSLNQETEERRRVLGFLAGFSAGLLPLLVIVLGEPVIPAFHNYMLAGRHREISNAIVYTGLLIMPFSTAYAVAAHGVLEARLAVHRALRMGLARATVGAVAVLPWVAVAVVLWRGRGQRVEELLAGGLTPWVWAGLVTGALYLMRARLLSNLETRLLGAKAESGSVISRFSRVTSRIRHLEELPAAIDRAARDLVRADYAMLLVRTPEGTLTSIGEDCSPPTSSAIPELLLASHHPFSLDARDADSLVAWLPPLDREWAHAIDARLMAPLFSPPGELAGSLCFGPARSGTSYTKRDADATTGLATAVGLVLDRLRSESRSFVAEASADTTPAGECRTCGVVGPSASGTCQCGRALSEALLPWELAGKFRLKSILGRGGMGLVYEAVDITLGRTVALKTLPRLDDAAAARLREEARSMARLMHPNLALIFGAEFWQSVPVLVVEYLAGGSLEKRVGSGLGVRQSLNLGIRLADALAEMHGAGLLHRDIKPSNIGFAANGQVKLLDFGLAHIAEKIDEAFVGGMTSPPRVGGQLRLTLTGYLAGTPLYMSPEALAGAVPSVAQDLWSLHLVLWLCLAGHHPHDHLPAHRALRRLRLGELPSLRSVRKDVDRGVVEVIDAGLRPNCSERPQSAVEVKARLEEALAALR